MHVVLFRISVSGKNFSTMLCLCFGHSPMAMEFPSYGHEDFYTANMRRMDWMICWHSHLCEQDKIYDLKSVGHNTEFRQRSCDVIRRERHAWRHPTYIDAKYDVICNWSWSYTNQRIVRLWRHSEEVKFELSSETIYKTRKTTNSFNIGR